MLDPDIFLGAEAAAGRFRGTVLLARDGEVTLRAGYGLANEEWQIPNTPATKFRIGSLTKTFTAAAVLLLAERDALRLGDEIGTRLGDLPEAWRRFTVHQLLTHTTGLRDHLAVPAKRIMNRTGARPLELASLIATQPLLFDPGAGWSYSNTGYVLLGMLIEQAGGRPYGTFLEEEICRPLGLSSTAYDSAARIVEGRAAGYALDGGHLVNADFLDMTVPYAAGGLLSMVDDLWHWNTALHEGGFLHPDSYARMTTRYPETARADGYYGYGLFLSKPGEQDWLAHSGGVNGFLAMTQYYPRGRGSLIVLSNLMHPPSLQAVVSQLSPLFLD